MELGLLDPALMVLDVLVAVALFEGVPVCQTVPLWLSVVADEVVAVAVGVVIRPAGRQVSATPLADNDAGTVACP